MAADELRFRVTADGADAAAKEVGKVQEAVDKLEGSTAQVSVEAEDQATETLEGAQESVDELDGADATVAVEADDEATEPLEGVQGAVDDLDGAEATVAVGADDEATDTLGEVQGAVDDLDGASAEVGVEADDEASDTLGDVQGAVDDLDGAQAEVEVAVDDKASGALDGIASKAGEAAGALGGMSGPLSEVTGLLGGLVSGPTAAIAGLAAAAGKGLTDFQNLALEVDNFTVRTGASADEASRWIEVAKDLGTNVTTVETAFGRMNREAEDSPQKFDDIGAAIVRNRDGTLNATETFIGVLQALNGIGDAGIRADAGNQILGRGWQQMSQFVGLSADDLRARLQGVSDVKIFDAAKIEKGKAMRDAFDEMADASDDLFLALGEALVPAIEDVAPAMASLVEAAGPVIQVLGQGIAATVQSAVQWMDALQTAADKTGVSFVQLGTDFSDFGVYRKLDAEGTAALEDDKRRADELGTSLGGTSDAFGRTKGATQDAKDALTAWGEETAASFQRVADLNQALLDEADALVKVSDAFGNAADDQITYNDAQTDFATKAADSKAKTDDVRDAAIDAAKAHAGLYTSMTESAGATATATGKLDAQNESLLTAAATARGPARQAIIDYIATLNGIPPEKMTEIQAAIDRGDLVEAQRLLDEASANRTATVNADANTAEANRELDHTARDRTATISVGAVLRSNLPGSIQKLLGISGTSMSVPPPTSSSVAAPAALGPSQHATSSVPVVTNHVTNNVIVPRIPSGRELARTAQRWSRVNGKG